MTDAAPWWKKAVIYQIYPRSFQDSNGDGIGDIPGIISRLPYLEKLGIDAIWLSPVYRSPQDDNGYDISDYQDIDPIFGTLSDMDRLIAEAGKRGIRIIMDLVLNHSSDEHPWFLEIIPAETYTMKDLNWKNPRLRSALYSMIRWWTQRGIRGFRLDVVDHLGKDPDLGIKVNGPMLHPYLREMRLQAFSDPGLVTVGEAWSADTDSAKLYSNPDGSELSMVFQFDHMKLDQRPEGDKWDLVPLDFIALKQIFTKWQRGLSGCGWNSLFWENHDLPRSISHLADDGEYRIPSAKMLAILLHGMQGTPYVYQGEELGMTNAWDFTLEEYQDIEIRNMIREKRAAGLPDEEILRRVRSKGRDNARTPMQWDAGPQAGFSSGTPWLRVNPNYREINAASQVDRPGSVFECYRTLIRLRKELPVFTDGTYVPLLEDHEKLFAYRRQDSGSELLVICNFSAGCTENPLAAETAEGELLVCSYESAGQPSVLRPYEARMYLKTRDLGKDEANE